MTRSFDFLLIGGILGILVNGWFSAPGVLVLCVFLLAWALIDTLR